MTAIRKYSVLETMIRTSKMDLVTGTMPTVPEESNGMGTVG